MQTLEIKKMDDSAYTIFIMKAFIGRWESGTKKYKEVVQKIFHQFGIFERRIYLLLLRIVPDGISWFLTNLRDVLLNQTSGLCSIAFDGTMEMLFRESM